MVMTCEIIADTILDGERLTTIRYEVWRPLHSELLTYRECARNASSSRAVPFRKNLAKVLLNPTIPSQVGKEHPGMLLGKQLSPGDQACFEQTVQGLIYDTVRHVKALEAFGIHKSILNRYLEPFNIINVLMTGKASHWEHIFEQRCTPVAEPNLRLLCEEIREAYADHKPTESVAHLPYIDASETFNGVLAMLKVSAARCARLSYTPFGEPIKNTKKDLELADRLIKSGHLSPCEHQLLSRRVEITPMNYLPDNAVSKVNFTFRQLLEKGHFNGE